MWLLDLSMIGEAPFLLLFCAFGGGRFVRLDGSVNNPDKSEGLRGGEQSALAREGEGVNGNKEWKRERLML